MDKDLREAKRSHVELAASLGHALARDMFPDVEAVDWSKHDSVEGAIRNAVEQTGDETLPARVAVEWAERVSGLWGLSVRCSPDVPKGALAATRAWIACPCLHCEQGAWNYSESLEGALLATGSGFDQGAGFSDYDMSPEEEEEEEDKYEEGPGADACQAAAAAARAADSEVEISSKGASVCSIYAVSAAEGAADADAAAVREAEREWQRLRLAAYVLGEVDLDEPAAP
jgi:hypothetical protein